MHNSLKKLNDILSDQQKGLCFLTLDPLIAYPQSIIFQNFINHTKIPIYGFLHRLPASRENLENIKNVIGKLAAIFCLSQDLVKELRDLFQTDNIHYIPHHPANFRDEELVPAQLINLRKSFGITPDQIIVGQIGEQRPDKGISLLLDSLQFLTAPAKEKLVFLIAGNLHDHKYEELAKKFIETRTNHIILESQERGNLHASLDSKRFTQLMQITDIGLLLYQGSQRMIASGNLSNYAWFNKTIVGTHNSSCGALIERHQLGYTLKSETASELAETLMNCLDAGALDCAATTDYQAYRNHINPNNAIKILVQKMLGSRP